MEIHGMTPHSLRKAAEKLPSTHTKDAQLEKACKEFESLFLNQLLSSMRKTVKLGGGEKESREKQMYQGMMDNEMSKNWSKTGGIGLAQVLYQQMQARGNTKPNV